MSLDGLESQTVEMMSSSSSSKDVEAQELASVGTRIKRTVHMARVTGRAYSVLTLGATAVSQPADHSAVLASFTIALD